jgi:hypothetical protein
MGMCLVLRSVSDTNIQKLIAYPPLVFRLIAHDEPEFYLAAVKDQTKTGFFAKLFGSKKSNAPVEPTDFQLTENENFETDLDKAWQGIHYCLNKTAYEAIPPMDFLTIGGVPCGDIEIGIGPGRLFTSDIVAEIYKGISVISNEQFHSNYDPTAMDELDIYPQFWERDGEEGFEYIQGNFEFLKNFLSHCVTHKIGMLAYIC